MFSTQTCNFLQTQRILPKSVSLVQLGIPIHCKYLKVNCFPRLSGEKKWRNILRKLKVKELVSTGWMKNWFVGEEKSSGLLTDFCVYCSLFPVSPSLLQLNEPSSLGFSSQGMCSSPQMFPCSSFTEDPETECSIPGGINLGSLNSLWVQKLKFPWACPRPWTLLGRWESREREQNSRNSLCFWAVWAVCSRQDGQRPMCLPQNVSAWVLLCVLTALNPEYPPHSKMHLAVCCELSLPWYFLWISYFQRSEHTPIYQPTEIHFEHYTSLTMKECLFKKVLSSVIHICKCSCGRET